jgi:hypothetical protein
MDRIEEGRWIPIEDWLSRRQAPQCPRVPLGFDTPAARDEILALRRKKSGPGVSHHSSAMPRHQRTA